MLAAGGGRRCCSLWRVFDRPNTQAATAIGLQWGFVYQQLRHLGFLDLRRASAWAGRPPGRAAPARRGRGHRADRRPAPAAPETPPTAVTEPHAPSTPPARASEPPPTAATQAIPSRPTRRARERAQEPDLERDQLAMELTQSHGSEEPLPRDDLTLELSDERSERRDP